MSRCPFLSILVSFWDSPGTHFGYLCVIWGANMEHGFQVHVFGDPGMEMMPEGGVCMCCGHSKNNGYRDISLFTNLLSRGMVLGTILVYFGDLGTTFSDFRGYRNRDRGRDRDRAPLDHPRLRAYTKWKVELSFQRSSKLTAYKLTTILPLDTRL